MSGTIFNGSFFKSNIQQLVKRQFNRCFIIKTSLNFAFETRYLQNFEDRIAIKTKTTRYVYIISFRSKNLTIKKREMAFQALPLACIYIEKEINCLYNTKVCSLLLLAGPLYSPIVYPRSFPSRRST